MPGGGGVDGPAPGLSPGITTSGPGATRRRHPEWGGSTVARKWYIITSKKKKRIESAKLVLACLVLPLILQPQCVKIAPHKLKCNKMSLFKRELPY